MSVNKPVFKLKNWIPVSRLNWSQLSKNPNAINLLEQHPHLIDWKELSYNPNAIHLLEQNPEKIDWNALSQNPNAIHLLQANITKVKTSNLLFNPNALKLVMANANKRIAVKFIKEYKFYQHSLYWNYCQKIPLEKINWRLLSANPFAIDFLLENKHEILWRIFSGNPNAVPFLEQHSHLIDWFRLSSNPNALHLLQANPEKIDWFQLSKNPSIFELDYETMRTNNLEFYEELVKEVKKPSRVFKNPDYDYLEELFGDD